VYTARGTSAAAEADKLSRAEAAYRALKRGLLMGEFPFGERLAEARLAKELDVSRTPVREALARLHAEDLVERHPEGGYRPAPPDLIRTHELYEIRFALELHALRLLDAGDVVDRAALRELHDEWAELSETTDRPPDPGFVLLDEEFHVRLAAVAGNDALVEALVGVNERIRPVRMHDFLTAERITITIAEHRSIVAAVLAGDLATGRERLDDHLHHSLEVVRRRAAEALGRMVGRARAVEARTGVRP
jgi:DNA-binding GntR family transcriptional regulator